MVLTDARRRPRVLSKTTKKRVLGGLIAAVLTSYLTMFYQFQVLASPISLSLSGFYEPKIPRRILFTYSHNILEQKSPDDLYQNVKSTIEKYVELWGGQIPVWFLDDAICRSVIQTAKPELLAHFDAEIHGSYKADICRVAALALSGGYYFDVDMEVVQPYEADDDVGFVTALDGSRLRYFQSFLAAKPNSPILVAALDVMLAYYSIPLEDRPAIKVGPETLWEAVNAVPASRRGNIVIMEELNLEANKRMYPDVARLAGVGCCCNFVVHDPKRTRVYFRSRIIGWSGGSNFCQLPGYADPAVMELKKLQQSQIASYQNSIKVREKASGIEQSQRQELALITSAEESL